MFNFKKIYFHYVNSIKNSFGNKRILKTLSKTMKFFQKYHYHILSEQWKKISYFVKEEQLVIHLLD